MFELSQKYIDFCNTVEGVHADFLEGTTASGKTTVGASIKFMLMVSRSDKRQHIIASKTVGTAEKNILQADHGILSFHTNATYYGNGSANIKIPHIVFEEKIIYILGYDDISKWKMVLGSQFGCVYIDEINTANIEFVREISTRNDYLMATLNPDDPSLLVYKEFINRSRPYNKYKADIPCEILEELKEPPVPGWKYWFFSFKDNLGLTDEDIEKKKRSAPPGTKLYKNKILGLRGRSTGLVFGNFDYARNVRTESWVREELKKKGRYEEGVHSEDQKGFGWLLFTSAMDTSYSKESEDTISMIFQGITDTGILITLDEEVINNKDSSKPVSPSDVCELYVAFLERNRKKWGFSRYNFIDSADQATLREMEKYVARTGSIYNFDKSYKKKTIMDRIILQRGWIQDGYYIVLAHCEKHLDELNNYSYIEEKGIPEDRNDHTINANQYAWLPYIGWIGQR